MRVSFPIRNRYADLRPQGSSAWELHEPDSPPESLLQSIWEHQRVRRGHLHTLDGAPLRILHPGFRSREGGPDFRGAVIQRAEASPEVGDVEIDVRVANWRSHRHHLNPRFRDVILHIVWEVSAAPNKAHPPILPLAAVLDASVEELADSLSSGVSCDFPPETEGQCAGVLRAADASGLDLVLRQAAVTRFQQRAELLRARALETTWDQALWEGLFRGLGYKHNRWPMTRLAELRPRWQKKGSSDLAMEARLLGIAGLLPSEPPSRSRAGQRHWRELWDCWWRERDEFTDCILPAKVWRLGGSRPANHPQRRVALGAALAQRKDLVRRLGAWAGSESELQPRVLLSSLTELLSVRLASFWRRHWTLRSQRAATICPILGPDRVTDLAVNTILPWAWALAAETDRPTTRQRIEARFLEWPRGADNTVLRLARSRITRRAKAGSLRTAAAQQGLMQIVRDFCDHSNALCDHCNFPAVAMQMIRDGD